MKINMTPRKTSNNYGINSYEIDDNLLKKEIGEFNSYKLTNVSINPIKPSVNIKYGVGSYLINQIKENNNFSYEVLVDHDGIIEFNLNKKNASLVDYISVVVPKNAKVNLIIIYKSTDKGTFYHNGLIKSVISENSKAKISVINLLNSESVNIISIDNEFADTSKLEYNIIDLGASKSISNYYSNLSGENSINDLNSIFLGNRNQEFDINYIVECNNKDTKVNIDVEGVLDDEAKKNFKGTIDFKKGSSGSVGYEKEFTTLLSSRARSKSLPMLLCGEEDSIGNHSSASGKVSKKLMFYMNSRGLSYKEALRILVKAKFSKTINNIDNESIISMIEKIINEHIEEA